MNNLSKKNSRINKFLYFFALIIAFASGYIVHEIIYYDEIYYCYPCGDLVPGPVEEN